MEDQKIEYFRVAREMLAVQGANGNWDYDEYMHGLYNGMEFVLSLIEGREPEFRKAPNRFKKYNSFREGLKSTGEAKNGSKA